MADVGLAIGQGLVEEESSEVQSKQDESTIPDFNPVKIDDKEDFESKEQVNVGHLVNDESLSCSDSDSSIEEHEIEPVVKKRKVFPNIGS